MNTTNHPRLHKAFSAFTALALAMLMVPIAPTQAMADGVSTPNYPVLEVDDTAGLAISLAYDAYGANDPVPQAFSSDGVNIEVDVPTVAQLEVQVTDLAGTAAADAATSASAAMGDEASKDLSAKFSDSGTNDAKTAIETAMRTWAEGPDGEAAVKKAIAAKVSGLDEDDIESVTADNTSSINFGTKTGSETPKATNAEASNESALTPAIASVTGAEASNVTTDGVEQVAGTSVSLSNQSDSSFSVTAQEPGISTLALKYRYDTTVTGYTYTYSGTYDYTYSKFSYSGWTFTQKYTYTYKKDNEVKIESTPVEVAVDGGDVAGEITTPITGSGSIDATGTNARTVTQPVEKVVESTPTSKSYDISVINLFQGVVDDTVTADTIDLRTMTYTDVSEKKATLGGVSFADEAAALSRLKLSQPSSEYIAITVAEGGKSLTAKATRQTGGEAKTVNVTWKYEGTRGTLTVIQPVQVIVNPLEIKMSAIELPFRLQSANEKRALEAANKEIKEETQQCGDTISTDYFSTVNFAGYDTNGNETKTFAASDWTPASGNAYSNYKIIAPQVTVKAMEKKAWAQVSDLVLNANETITSGNATSQWVNTVPSASYPGFKLAYAPKDKNLESAGSFGDAAALDKGDGEHALEVYAMDGDEVISRVTGVSYMLDTQAPTLTGFEASGVRHEGGILFGKNKVDVKLGIADLNEGDVTSATNTSAKVSGIDGAPKVTYRDSEAKKDVKADGKFSSNVYSFTVDSNQDVPASSIKVEAQDKAGNKLDTTADKSRDIPVEITRLVAEGDKPELSVSWDNNDVRNGRYYSADRTITITVTDHFFNYIVDYVNDQAVMNVYRGDSSEPSITVHPSDFSEAGANKWTYSLSFTAEDDWKVSTISIRDVVGNSASASGDSFTIDKTAPSMDVVFDNDNAANGNYYNAARTATITVTEHNFVEDLVNIETTASAGNGDTVGSPNISGWSSDGDIRTATVNFPGEGVYTLDVSGRDGADNTLATYTASEFVIDTQTPEIDISGVGNREAYSGSAQPSVSVRDTNISDTTSIELSKIGYPASGEDANPYNESRSNATTEITVSYPDAPDSVENDGVYTITVQATDMAGNTADQAVTWSVNRFGSTYVIADDTSKMLNNYLQSDKVGNVIVTEINPSSLNENATAIELTHDTSNSTLKRDSDYSIEENGASGWSEYTYNVAKKNFGSDGAYRVLFHSEDAASNTSENTMKNKNASRSAAAEIAFAVDDTSPVVSFVDLVSNGLYEESSHSAQVNIQDNLKPESATVKVDGQTVLDLDADALASSTTHAFEVPESGTAHEVTVTAYDAAGNAETVTAPNVTVTTDAMKLWMSNTPLFVGTIVGGVAVIGAAVAFFLFRVRRPML